MKYQEPLIHGKLVQRYKRFLADVELDSGEIITAHCTNSGSMKSCLEEGAEVYLSPVNDPKRKTQYTWEMIKLNGKWVGINTAIPNRLAFESLQEKSIPGLDDYEVVKREVTFGDSRFDLYVEKEGESCFIEVKNVTMKEGEMALFPDAVTTRGQKHLETLIKVKQTGMRAVMLYIIQRMDVDAFGPAAAIDPLYAEKLHKACVAGVEVIPLQVEVSPFEIRIHKILPFVDLG
ncbi:MAG: DNA/RNA nuclease SfsA [Bacteroidota bacterium]|nr:DNA/RNA nuclease SfsA [Bacteroidota bacterium]